MQEQIAKWHRKTFPDATDENVFAKAHEEIIELTWELADSRRYDPELIANEFADVYIVMAALLDRIGGNMESAIKNKMEINKKRKWTKDGRARL